MKLFDSFPIIILDDIILREITENDAEHYLEYVSHPLVNKFISDPDIPHNLPESKEELQYWQDLFRMKRSIYWGIAKKSNNELIGTCGFNSWSRIHHRAEVSYDLSHKEWNKGIMTKVVKEICHFAFVQMNVQRIQATVAEDNIASSAVLKKLNFTQEGLMKSYAILHGEQKDFFLYSLLVP